MVGKKRYLLKIFLHSIFILNNQQTIFAIDDNNIQGQLIDNGNFDSKFSVVTMVLSQFNPPVVRITPARPTTIMFPFNLSYCTSNNSAIKIDTTNSIVQGSGNIFSEITVIVDGKAVQDIGDRPDQTVINCKSVDNTPYPIGISFVEKNAFSFVKLITSSGGVESQASVTLPSNFSAIDLTTKKMISLKEQGKEENQIDDEKEEDRGIQKPNEWEERRIKSNPLFDNQLNLPINAKPENSIIVTNKIKNHRRIQMEDSLSPSVSRSEIADIRRALDTRHFHTLNGNKTNE